MSESAEKLYEEADRLGEDWADKDAAHWVLDETIKNVLSEAIGRVNDQTQSRVAKEDEARRDPVFREHLESVETARRAKNVAQIKYKNYLTYIELLRSKAATQREQMKLR